MIAIKATPDVLERAGLYRLGANQVTPSTVFGAEWVIALGNNIAWGQGRYFFATACDVDPNHCRSPCAIRKCQDGD